MELIHQELSRFYFELKEATEETLVVLLGLELLVGYPILNINTALRSLSSNNRDVISQDFLYDLLAEAKDLNYTFSDKLTVETASNNITFQEADGLDGFSLLKISNKDEEQFIILAFHYLNSIRVVKAYTDQSEEIRNLIANVG